MQLSEIQDECARLLGDPSHDRWSAETLLYRINRSCTKVVALTNSVKTKETLTAVASTATVSLDSDVIDIIRVDIKRTNGDWVKLRGYLRDQLDFENPNWQQLSVGEPVCYWWDGTNQQLNLVPAPDSANALASGLRVWEIQKPADMVNASDVPFSSNAAMIPYHMAIVHDVVADCWQDDGTPESMQKSRFHRSGVMERPGEFERELKLINSKFDAPEDIPARILWQPTGGRASRVGMFKNNPLGQ